MFIQSRGRPSRVNSRMHCSVFFFFNDTATTEIYTLSLHDALPISARARARGARGSRQAWPGAPLPAGRPPHERGGPRSEEHTSELQSRLHLVCRLLLEKKKNPLIPRPLSRPEQSDAHHTYASERRC